jgi:hypothetical protein
MELAWIATDPTTDRMAFTETRSDIGGYMSRLRYLLSAGEGYTQVRRGDTDFPMLAFSFRGGYGVIHMFDSPDDCRLLRGDGILPATETVEVPVHGDVCPFSGDFVSGVARASATIGAFVHGASVEQLGEWCRL